MLYLILLTVVLLALFAAPKILKMMSGGSGRMGDPVDIIRIDLIPGSKFGATLFDRSTGRSMHAGGDRISFSLGRGGPGQKYPYLIEIHFMFADCSNNFSKCEMVCDLSQEQYKNIATVTVYAPTTLYQEKFLCKAWIVNANFDTHFWQNQYAKEDEEKAKKWFISKGFLMSGKVYTMKD